ncbi:MAG TPA: uroporphyrinogen decarboxylase, partial [Candidatus Omnitrophica bacterium]|nr:uroporphyrinogen decarboxylase [Candidatus Omnitrophota bacterium]
MRSVVSNSIFLQSFQGTNKQIPVWFMRQAGRYLPEYQALKKKHPLQKMFDTPELAAEITCLPVDIL